MHMERGIGRTGYLLLAFVLFAFGAFGLLLATVAFREGLALFYYFGAGTTAVALLGLYGFASLRPAPVAPRAPAPAPASTPVAAPAPAEGKEFEYNEYQAAAPAAPDRLVLPPAFRDDKPPMPMPQEEVVAFQSTPRPAPAAPAPTAPAARAPAPRAPASAPAKSTPTPWPQRRKPVPRPGQAPVQEKPSVRPELTERYTRNTPTVRRMLDAETDSEKPQEHVAERAPQGMNTDFVAPGMNVGKCGQCATLLLAPETRPIRLKCPECAKVTLLE